VRGTGSALALVMTVTYRGTSLIRKRVLLGPYRRPTPGALWWSWGGGRFFMSEVPLYTLYMDCTLNTRIIHSMHVLYTLYIYFMLYLYIVCAIYVWYFFSSLLHSSLELSDTKVYEPYVRALLGTAAHFCKVVVLKLCGTSGVNLGQVHARYGKRSRLVARRRARWLQGVELRVIYILYTLYILYLIRCIG